VKMREVSMMGWWSKRRAIRSWCKAWPTRMVGCLLERKASRSRPLTALRASERDTVGFCACVRVRVCVCVQRVYGSLGVQVHVCVFVCVPLFVAALQPYRVQVFLGDARQLCAQIHDGTAGADERLCACVCLCD
jgi:hypothetical protein